MNFFNQLSEQEQAEVEGIIEQDVAKFRKQQKELIALDVVRRRLVLAYWASIGRDNYADATAELEAIICQHGSFNFGMHKFRVEGEYDTLRIS